MRMETLSQHQNLVMISGETALILSVKDRRPANARHFGRQDLLDFQKGFDRKTYMEFKRRIDTKLESVTQKYAKNMKEKR